MARFAPLEAESLSAEQKSVPSTAKALADGTYNPTGYDAVMLRRPGLQDAINGVIAQVYPAVAKLLGNPAGESTLPHALVEMAILILSQKWGFTAMFRSHGPIAVAQGISQATVDAIAQGRRPDHMKADEAAVHDFCAELIDEHDVSDAIYELLKSHLSERDILDLIVTLGVYTDSLMILKVARIDTH